MYASPSYFQDELGDLDVHIHEGKIHLHHLCLPSHDIIGHAVSEDGLTFVTAPAALYTSSPGACDDDMIWTMHTVCNPTNNVYHMYYTACSLAEHGLIQRVALATSTDFIHWQKYRGNPVCVAAPPYYNYTLKLLGHVSFRDPFVFIEDGVWHMLVCATTAKGDRLRGGCVAHATSRDGFKWDLQKPLYAPCQFNDLEVPALLKHGNRYYLFFHELWTPQTYYRIADSLEGPWIAPKYDDLLPDNSCVTRFCEWEGNIILYSWYRCEADWHRRSPSYASLLPPKQVSFESDGSVRLSTFSGWKKYYRGEPVRLPVKSFMDFTEGPTPWRLSDGWIGSEVSGHIVGAAVPAFDDFILDIPVELER